jgi:hypothetical protein
VTEDAGAEHQPYDRALKSLMEDHAAEMLPELLPESLLVGEQNTEINRTNIRADLVYLIQYRGTLHILNLELQTNTDSDMPYRMLQYHLELYGKYRLPVISMVMYPFETAIPDPLFEEKSGEETLLAFSYRELRLWTLEAEPYVRKHVVSMYTLLPAMRGANAPMLLQVIEEMEQRYEGRHLGHHLVRLRTILRRSKTMSEQDKSIIEDRLHSYDSLLDEDPDFQEKYEKGKLQGQQNTIVIFVEARFPSLKEMAQQQVLRLTTSDDLNRLTKLLALAPDETTAQWVLSSFAA